MAQYQFIITPVDYYFFGGEKHRKKQGKLIADYFVETNPYPQQTTILGFIRYLLLTVNTKIFDGEKITDKIKAKELIGESSFSYPDPPASYGKINTLSPLYFLYRNGSKKIPYFFAPKDVKFNLKTGFLLDYEGEKYNAKKHQDKIGMYLTDGKEILPLSNIVSKHTKIGIEKRQKGDPPEEKFYKITKARLKENWSFAVDVKLKDGSNIKVGESFFIPFGGERSMFKVEIIADKSQFSSVLPQSYHRNVPYIFCESDCFAGGDDVKNAIFGVTEYISFRNLISKVKDTTKYSGLSHNSGNQLMRSSRYNLLRRGSVLYFETNDKLENFIKKINIEELKNIGFNHYITNI